MNTLNYAIKKYTESLRNLYYHDSVFQEMLIKKVKNGFSMEGEEWKNVLFYLDSETVEAIVNALKCDKEFERDSMWGGILSAMFYYEVLSNITAFNSLEWYWSGKAYSVFSEEDGEVEKRELLDIIFDGFEKCLVNYDRLTTPVGNLQISVEPEDPFAIRVCVGCMRYDLKKDGEKPTPEEIAENIRRAREMLENVKCVE